MRQQDYIPNETCRSTFAYNFRYLGLCMSKHVLKTQPICFLLCSAVVFKMTNGSSGLINYPIRAYPQTRFTPPHRDYRLHRPIYTRV